MVLGHQVENTPQVKYASIVGHEIKIYLYIIYIYYFYFTWVIMLLQAQLTSIFFQSCVSKSQACVYGYVYPTKAK